MHGDRTLVAAAETKMMMAVHGMPAHSAEIFASPFRPETTPLFGNR
jgi:hypothetical protein